MLIFFTAGTALSQSVDFKQAANNDSPYLLGDVHWITSILQASDSVYYEGMSVAQRVMFVSIPATTGNVHTLTLRHQATKGGKHAYDYMTSWPQALASDNAVLGTNTILTSLNECGPNLGPPNTMPATCNTLHSSGYFLDVDIPDVMGNSNVAGNIDASIAAYETSMGNRTVRIWGDAPITAGSSLSSTGMDRATTRTLHTR